VAALREQPDAPIATRAEPAPVVPVTKDLGALLRELRGSTDSSPWRPMSTAARPAS
jgi:hypothetical protein